MRHGFILTMLALMVMVTGCCAPLLASKGPGTSEGWIAFDGSRGNREGWNVYVMRADGSGVTRLTDDKEDSKDPAWSPDGMRIAFVRMGWQAAQIYVMNADGSGQRQLTDSPEYNEGPAWSPDGQWIAFASKRDRDFEIYVMNADGSEQTRLTDSPGRDCEEPAWSPDGTQIAFYRSGRDDGGVYVMRADGSQPVRLAEGRAPAWSPDGKCVAFAHWEPGEMYAQIYVIGADGAGLRRVTENRQLQGDCSNPAWSPDGAWLVFGTHEGLAVVRPDGTGYAPLTRKESHTAWWIDGAPSWAAASR